MRLSALFVMVPLILTMEPGVRQTALQLEGVDNFRDSSGYTTPDDDQIRRGMLYRSGISAT